MGDAHETSHVATSRTQLLTCAAVPTFCWGVKVWTEKLIYVLKQDNPANSKSWGNEFFSEPGAATFGNSVGISVFPAIFRAPSCIVSSSSGRPSRCFLNAWVNDWISDYINKGMEEVVFLIGYCLMEYKHDCLQCGTFHCCRKILSV